MPPNVNKSELLIYVFTVICIGRCRYLHLPIQITVNTYISNSDLFTFGGTVDAVAEQMTAALCVAGYITSLSKHLDGLIIGTVRV